jgi:hypothetical protein
VTVEVHSGPIRMSQPLLGRSGAKRVVLWERICRRGFDTALVAVVLFALATCIVGASQPAPFFETWWGRHLFVLLLVFIALPVLTVAGLPLLKQWPLPLDALPEVEPRGAGLDLQTGRRVLPKRTKVALAVVMAVPLLVLAFYLWENFRGEQAWNEYKRQQETRGEPMDAAALVPPTAPDEENFAATPFLAPLFDYAPGTQQPRDPTAVERLQNFSPRYEAASSQVGGRRPAVSNSWMLAGTDLRAWQKAFAVGGSYTLDFRDSARRSAAGPGQASDEVSSRTLPLATNAPAVAEAATEVLAGLSEAEPVLEELREASRRPYSRFNLRYDIDNPATMLLPHYAVLKKVVQVLRLRASAELALGRTDQACQDIQFMFRLIDTTRNEPVLIGHLVRLAMMNLTLEPLAEGLARHQWSDIQLRALEEQLRRFDFLADGRRAFHSERVFAGGLIDCVRRSPNKYKILKDMGLESGGNQTLGFSGQSALLAAMPSGWYYLEKVSYCRVFQDDLLPAIDVSKHIVNPGACERAAARAESQCAAPWPARVVRHQFFCGVLLPALSRTLQKTALAQTGADCAALACALERYRLAHGQFPDALSTLAPEHISQVPLDVVNGQPLHYRRTPDGLYLLYSVGWDATDGGGVISLGKNGQGLNQTMGDWVWRLPAG